MKISICNVPLRSEELKTVYPPLGPLAIVQALKTSGYDARFYDINAFRYPEAEIRGYFSENKFDIVGISATVSTSYAYVKKIALMIRSITPETVIVVGGALTASHEVLLKFAQVDYCVIGEGERTIVNLVRYISSNGVKKDHMELRNIKGISFLNNESSQAVFTGYAEQLSTSEIQDADYSLVERYSKIDNYFIEPFYYEQFKYDQRTFEKHRKGNRLATVITSRGCVNRCTFCYRGQRGIRIFPVNRVIDHIMKLKEDYNVGFISFGDEDFGASKGWLEEFIEKVRPLDILYRIGAICVTNVDLSILKRLRESGCVAVHYGFESGSDGILKVMEKRADVELNVKIARWTHEANLQTVYALVIGMPGETYETVKETFGFIKKITEFLPKKPVISINALVVLPGTPVYEYAKLKGLLGRTLEGEERYLLRISNQGGSETGSFRQLNLTDYPYFIVLGWIKAIYWGTNYNYHATHNIPATGASEKIINNRVFYRMRNVLGPAFIMYKNYKEDKGLFAQRCAELLTWPFRKRTFKRYVSLREYVRDGKE